MKTAKTLALAVFAICFQLADAQGAADPNTVPLAGQWRFALDAADVGISEAWYGRTLKDTIQLPGVLQAQGYGNQIGVDTPWIVDLFDSHWQDRAMFKPFATPGQVKNPYFSQPPLHYLGAAWYQHEITVPSSWAGKNVSLILELPHWRTDVWLDGRAIGFKDSLATPHLHNLGTVPPGKHQLTVRVDNRKIIPLGNDSHCISDQLGATWNGIVGRIELQARPKVRLDSIQVYPDATGKKVRISVSMANGSEGGGRGNLKVEARLRGSTNPVAVRTVEMAWTSEGGCIDLELSLGQAALLWDEFQPNLYELSVELGVPGGSPDRQTVTFGLRDFKAQGIRFAINGRAFSFRSTHFGGDFALTGHPAMDVASWKRIFKVCKAYGLNAMRFHSLCPPKAAFEAADEIGFYLQPEVAGWSGFEPGSETEKFLYEESARILTAYGNHPSFVMLSQGNEPWGKEKTKVIFPWVEHCRKLDSRRLYTAKTGHEVVPGDPSDFMTLMTGAGNARLRAFPGWFGKNYRDALVGMTIPVLAHEVGQWCALPDFDALIASMNGYLRPSNIELYRAIWQRTGMLDYNKFFAEASGRFQTLCYKEEIEANRRTPGIGGFTLLDLRDYLGQGTSPVGVVDPLWNPKGYVSPAEFRRFCGVTVPLARMTQQVYRAGAKLGIEVEIAHDGPGALMAAKPVWKVVNSSSVAMAKGAFPSRDIPTGTNTTLGMVVADMAAWPAPAQYRLVVGLDQSEVENDWDFWVYPGELVATALGDVLVTRDFDEAEARLAAGGKVFYLPRMTDMEWGSPATRNSPVFWNELLACGWQRFLGIWCDPSHSALAAFPTESHCNWQWRELVDTGRCRAMRVTGFDARLKPIVSVIDQMAHGEKLAMVFECRVGQGRLLVCSADLDYQCDTRLVARQLRHSLLNYVVGKDFQPSVAVAANELRSLLLDNVVMKKLGANAVADTAKSRASAAIDGDPNSFWQAGPGVTGKQPRWLEVDFPQLVDVEGLVYLPRQNHYLMEGCIRGYRLEVSEDGTNWTTAAQGEWPLSYDAQTVRFDRKLTVRKLKLTALSWVGEGANVSVGELTVLYAGPKLPAVKDGKVQYQKVRTSTLQVVEPE